MRDDGSGDIMRDVGYDSDPIVVSAYLTEGGDTLVTEGGDRLILD